MTTLLRICVGAALVAAGLFAQTDQKTSKENMVYDRGQTRLEPPIKMPGAKEASVSGILIDAGCKDRSSFNMRRAPETVNGATPPNMGAADRAAANPNITADVMEHHVADLFSRQS